MKRLAWSISILLLIAFFIYRKWDQLLSIAVALAYMMVFSLILSPVCSAMERRGIRTSFAAGYAVVGLFLLAFVMLAAFIPYLVAQCIELFKRTSPMAAQLVRQFLQWVEGLGGIRASFANAGSTMGLAMSAVTGTLLRMGMTAAEQIGRIAFSLILTYYVLCDRKRICCHLLLLIPLQWREAMLSALLACRNAMMGYLCGLMKTSIFVASATAIGLLALGVQDAVLLAILMGVFEIFPYIGPILASIPILLCAMMQGTETAVLVLIMLVLVQQIEGNIITPYFTASTTSVHPFLTILSVFVVGSLFGAWGILLGVPILVLGQSVMWSLCQRRSAIKSCIGTTKVLCM